MKYQYYEMSDDFNREINDLNPETMIRKSDVVMVGTRKFTMTVNIFNTPTYTQQLQWHERFRESLNVICKNTEMYQVEAIEFSTEIQYKKQGYVLQCKLELYTEPVVIVVESDKRENAKPIRNNKKNSFNEQE